MKRALLTLSVVAGAACSSSPAHEQSSAQPASPPRAAQVARGKVIGVLALQGERLTIRASDGGPRFDVVAADGRLLSRDIDLRELAIRHAEIYEVYRSSYARAAEDEPFLDGRID